MSGEATPPLAFELQPLVARPDDIRVFGHERRAGIAEVAASGRLRLDSIARWAQDVAWADVEDAGLRELTVWLVRRTRIRVRRFPRLDESFTLSTYVTGLGRMWAERRTDIVAVGGGPEPNVELSCIWVHIDPSRLMPSPVDQVEIDMWTGPSTREVKARLRHPAADVDAPATDWTFRASEVDIAVHVNNAAYLTPLEDELIARSGSAQGSSAGEPAGIDVEMEYRTPAQAGEKRLHAAGPMRWIVDPASGEVHASAMLADWPGLSRPSNSAAIDRSSRPP
jgi:acyl-ACP thioesterase